MDAKKILVLNGHPAKQSLSGTLAEAYATAAEQGGHSIRRIQLHNMQFDMDHGIGGYRGSKPLEESLAEFMNQMEWAEHIVMSTPMWWGGLPAKLKGVFDRAFLPGNAFNPRIIECGAPRPLLTGKTARVIVTSDTPSWFMAFVYHNAFFIQLRKQLFQFVGIKPTRFSHFNEASHPPTEKINQWIEKCSRLGKAAA